MGLIMTMIGLVCAVAVAAVSRLLADEAKAWLPTLTEWFVKVAIRRLPISQHERYTEEWRSHICELPGDVSKLMTAVGYVVAAGKIRVVLELSERALFQSLGAKASAVGLLFLFLPMFLYLAILIKIDSPGPIFVRRKLRGSERLYLTFRTSRVCSEHKFTITRVGRVLRRYSFDLTPVLIDVLLGRAAIGFLFSQLD